MTENPIPSVPVLYQPEPAVDRSSWLSTVKQVLTPNQTPSRRTTQVLWLGWVVAAMLLWQFWPSAILPRPMEVVQALKWLWFEEGLGQQLIISYWVQLQALAIATIVALLLAYAATIPIIRPVVIFISTWRFVSLGPLVIFFSLLVTSEGHALKVLLMIFTIVVFYVTSMLPVVLDVPTEELEHARTLRMNEWRVAGEAIVLGRLDIALDMLRQNAAMGWMLITMIEGLVRSEGGIGVLMLNELKHFKLAEVAAIIAVLFVVGFTQDIVLQALRRLLFPYADLEKERR